MLNENPRKSSSSVESKKISIIVILLKQTINLINIQFFYIII